MPQLPAAVRTLLSFRTCNRLITSSFLALAILVLSQKASAQSYILNEDFSTAAGTTPPAGWTNTAFTGQSTDRWQFDNPGNRTINYPITGAFAIFDSRTASPGGGPEEVVLETRFFDASVSNNILLSFDHFFQAAPSSKAFLDVYNGTTWSNLASWDESTTNPQSEVFNLSARVGGKPSAKLRFRYQGDNSQFWAIDNIRILSPIPVDGALTGITSPRAPLTPGTYPITVKVANFGINPLTSTTISWTLNGITQTPFNWTGNLPTGAVDTAVVLGTATYPIGRTANIRAWQKNPNNLTDPNTANDTVKLFLAQTLCGTYTLGNATSDFPNLSTAATALNTLGISCPVTFLVQRTTVADQATIGAIRGSSPTNTVTFRGLDSTASRIANNTLDPANDFTIRLQGTSYITFDHLGISRNNGYQNLLIEGGHHITVRNCPIGSIYAANTDSALTITTNRISGLVTVIQPDTTTRPNVLIRSNTWLSGGYSAEFPSDRLNLFLSHIRRPVIRLNKANYSEVHPTAQVRAYRIYGCSSPDISRNNLLVSYFPQGGSVLSVVRCTSPRIHSTLR